MRNMNVRSAYCLRLLDYILEGSVELGQSNNGGHVEEVYEFWSDAPRRTGQHWPKKPKRSDSQLLKFPNELPPETNAKASLVRGQAHTFSLLWTHEKNNRTENLDPWC